ncbi:uncharacterized protein [Clytia hemisphaerica]|uniref:ShKT domain-containing protein n=1 Tax=Clytia hemisphaerica TaxID=252671 RepID=A0A7M5VAC6_9CNID|eukprot:TCONS_00004404-protein
MESSLALLMASFGLLYATVKCDLSKTDWFHNRLEEPNCYEADQVKCETSLYWQALCQVCKDCYNVCPECRDQLVYCKQMAAFTKEQQCNDPDSDVYHKCPNTCGRCKCKRSVMDIHHNWQCQQHFKRVAKKSRALHDEL